jgi:hypothetical protein
MNKLFSIILFFILLKSNAQITGVSFAPDGTHWCVEDMFYGAPPSVIHCWGSFRINGDTIINNKYLQKLDTGFFITSSYYDTICMAPSKRYLYYNNRVLYIDTVLLYDFNLNNGDTFNLHYSFNECGHPVGYYKMVVDSVDSIYYGNKWRKRINFKQMSSFNFGPVRWVEGIGDIDYGFFDVAFVYPNSPYSGIEHAFCFGGYERLNCFQEPGQVTYGNYCQNGSCTTGINEINVNDDVFIYPNPTSGKFTTQVANGGELKITNVLGECIHQSLISNLQAQFPIDLSLQPEGVYFVQIKTAEGNITKKIVVQH